MSLANKAMLTELHIKMVGQTRKDTAATLQANTANNATADAGSYVKRLFTISDMAGIINIASQARIYHKKMTLPWGDSGERLLPSKQFLAYSKQMNTYKNDYMRRVKIFVSAYAQRVSNASSTLGTMFVPGEYPDVKDIENEFSFNIDIKKITTADDFRVDLEKEELEQLKEKISDTFKNNQKEAMDNVWHQLYSAIEKIASKMSEEKPKIYKSMISNLINLTDILPNLNITNDQVLQSMCDDVQSRLCDLDVDDLRESAEIRNDTQITATEVLSKIDSYLGKS